MPRSILHNLICLGVPLRKHRLPAAADPTMATRVAGNKEGNGEGDAAFVSITVRIIA
jgi:hypothetical protein